VLAGLFFSLDIAQLLFLSAAANEVGLGSLGIGIVIGTYTRVRVLTNLWSSELANRRAFRPRS
jgi:hypothetical protein